MTKYNSDKTTPRHIVLISCASKKLNHRAKAIDMYVSTLFKKARAYAELLEPDCIYILSAKHHLLAPCREIDPYNESLKDKGIPAADRKKWASVVLSQIRKEGLDPSRDHFTILAGKAYYRYLVGEGCIESYSLPYKGIGGIGKMLKFLTEKINQNQLVKL